MNTKPIVLFATPVLHHPPVGGPTLRIENSIKALSKISDLYLYSRVPLDQIGGEPAAAFYNVCCRGLFFAPFAQPGNRLDRFFRRAVNYLGRRTVGRNLMAISYKYEEDFEELLRVAKRVDADVIWLGFGNISYPLLSYLKSHSDYKVIVDTDSVWSRFILRGLPYASSPTEREEILRTGTEKEKEERDGTSIADVTTAVSEVDAIYYRSLVDKAAKVRLFSNVIDLDMYEPIPPPTRDFKKPCMYLAGTFWRGSPMEDATRWVIKEVLPQVQQKIPDVHLYVVGSGSDMVLSDLVNPHVTVTGRLDSVLPYLGHATVSLVPLRYESGTRFKILEAGAAKKAVVSTTLGAEGIRITHRENILLADSPQSFADAIVEVILNTSLEKHLGENLFRLVSSDYSLRTLKEEGSAILANLGLEVPVSDQSLTPCFNLAGNQKFSAADD